MSPPHTHEFQGIIIGYDHELNEIVEAIARSGTGGPSHIAIIAEPMKGRTTMADEITRIYSDMVHRMTLDRVMTASAMPDLSSIQGKIILIDNCEFLATRKIGGFNLLNEFLKTQMRSKNLYITTWNSYAWRYLDAVMNLDTYYPVQITLPRMDTPAIKNMILSRYEPGKIQFVDEGTTESSNWYSVVHNQIKLPFIKRKITIPWIKLNFTVMRSRLPGEKRVQVSVEDIIFEKTNRIADGNPGVALHLFQNSIENNTISPRMIRENDCNLSPDINESFLLSLILSINPIHSNEISAMAGSEMDIDRILYRLLHRGVIMERAGHYCISPPYLNCVAEHLKKTRRVW